MYIGQTLLEGSNVFSPWLSREADNAIFSYEIIKSGGTPTFTVQVWHKNEEETGEGSLYDSNLSWTQIGSSGIWTATCTGLKELVRFEYDVTGSSGDSILFRMLESTAYNKA